MSTKGILGAVVGGTIGFFIGGFAGALWGASIGFGVGMALDPIQADTMAPGQMSEIQVTTAKYGDPIPDILGTPKLTGNIIWYCCDKTVEETEEAETGAKGGGSQTVVTGYKYYLSWAMALCLGPVDTLWTIYKDDDVIWDGKLDCPVAGGKESIYIEELETTIEFFFGTDDQEPLTALCRQLAAGNITGGPGNPVGTGACDDDDNLNVPYRNLCWVYVPEAYVGGYNRAPTLKFVVTKRPTITDSEGHDLEYGEMGVFDYNPAHAIWYIQEVLAGLPKSFMDSESFEAAAQTLFEEERGISILFAQKQSALTYIESVNTHAGMIERFDIDGSLHLKLIRGDETVSSLPVITENMLVEDPVVERDSWLNANNEVKVIFSERCFTPDECLDLDFEFDAASTPDSIDADSSITMYVIGGCPPFHWAVSPSSYTLGNYETYERENTLTAGNCLNGNATITVTDAAGTSIEFTINAGDAIALEFDDASTPDTIGCCDEIYLYILGGVAPFHWEIVSSTFDGTVYALESEYTYESGAHPRRNKLITGCCVVYDDAVHDEHYPNEVIIKVTDACGTYVNLVDESGNGILLDRDEPGHVCPDAYPAFDDDLSAETITAGGEVHVYGIGGCENCSGTPTRSIAIVDGFGYELFDTQNSSNAWSTGVRCAEGIVGVDYSCTVTIRVMDICGEYSDWTIRNTSGGWVLKGRYCGQAGSTNCYEKGGGSEDGYTKYELIVADRRQVQYSRDYSEHFIGGGIGCSAWYLSDPCGSHANTSTTGNCIDGDHSPFGLNAACWTDDWWCVHGDPCRNPLYSVNGDSWMLHCKAVCVGKSGADDELWYYEWEC